MLDESVNLAAALHFAGWRRVIGTLWSVWDADAAQITADVYARLTRNADLGTLSPAQALHATLRNYRRRHYYADQPSRWAQFLHIGP